MSLFTLCHSDHIHHHHSKSLIDPSYMLIHIISGTSFHSEFSGGFTGGRAGSAPPPSPVGDRVTMSLTVMLANAKF